MAILLQDSLQGVNTGAYVYLNTDANFTFADGGMTIQRIVGGDYTRAGWFTKRKFILKPGLTVQVDIRKTISDSNIFAFSGWQINQELNEGGVGNAYGWSFGLNDISTVSVAFNSSTVVQLGLVFDTYYTLKVVFTQTNAGAYQFDYYIDGSLKTSIDYAPQRGFPFVGNEVLLHLGAGFYASAAINYRNLVISSTPYDTPETTTSFDPLLKEYYV